MHVGEKAESDSRSERRRRLERGRRLRRRAEFVRVYDEGIRAGGCHMVVFARERDDDGPGGVRLGVTASRRIGNAVVRNRCKRRLRELFRTHESGFGGRRVDVVINARRGLADAAWSELEREYVRCVRQVTQRLVGP